jgi:hypothetical protein
VSLVGSCSSCEIEKDTVRRKQVKYASNISSLVSI